jgi:hypothetical protein
MMTEVSRMQPATNTLAELIEMTENIQEFLIPLYTSALILKKK